MLCIYILHILSSLSIVFYCLLCHPIYIYYSRICSRLHVVPGGSWGSLQKTASNFITQKPRVKISPGSYPRLVHSTILLLDFDIISSCCWTWFSLFPSITPIEAQHVCNSGGPEPKRPHLGVKEQMCSSKCCGFYLQQLCFDIPSIPLYLGSPISQKETGVRAPQSQCFHQILNSYFSSSWNWIMSNPPQKKKTVHGISMHLHTNKTKRDHFPRRIFFQATND